MKNRKKNSLRQKVLKLYNDLFTNQIDDDEKNVVVAVMSNLVMYYIDSGGSPLETALLAEKCLYNIEEEKTQLTILKKLLRGDKVRIFGMRGEFCLWGIFYDLRTGEKYVDEDEVDNK
ncbi:MAG: hypothetical protein M5T52_23060 [Ignavibacteriaceae bacterium]|nr:hypothetical protein [Ignavibacteriaceae bacterium]